MKSYFLTLLLCLAAASAMAGDGRIEISQDMVPLVIANGGSYVLTEDLAGSSGQNGITINADNVTLDLNGFQLSGGGGSLDVRANYSRFLQRGINQGQELAYMVTGGQFRHDSTVLSMDGNLAIQAMRKQAAVCIEYSHPGLITTGFYS